MKKSIFKIKTQAKPTINKRRRCSHSIETHKLVRKNSLSVREIKHQVKENNLRKEKDDIYICKVYYIEK
jgi:hypothetical protein